MKHRFFALVVLAISFASAAVSAQHTGGSFGGSHWGSSGSSHSSDSSGSGSSHSWGSSGSSGSGSSHSWGSSDSSSDSSSGSSSRSWGSSRSGDYGSNYNSNYRSGGSGGTPMDGAAFVFLLVVIGCYVLGMYLWKRNWTPSLPSEEDVFGDASSELLRPQMHSNELPPTRADVVAISLALDWRARPFIQERLMQLASSGDSKSQGGLALMLREVVATLRKYEIAWIYAGAVSTPPISPDRAQTLFTTTANEMRTRYRAELIRSADGVRIETTGPVIRAREAEGAGVVVVTLVVAAREEIPDISSATNAHELRNVMTRLGAVAPSSLLALEVIWSPAMETDRMSTAELETLYPEMKRMREDTMVGRVFCGYCSGPFAAELKRCPHCGAPASDARRA